MKFTPDSKQKQSTQETLETYKKYISEYEKFKKANLNLNMSRGKPCPEQLDLSMPMLKIFDENSKLTGSGETDYRNYGILDGIPEIKKFISDLTDLPKDDFIVGGNSSLSMMFDTISYFMIHGISGNTPWCKQKEIKFLCPSPGYDRHFAMCQHFGIKLIPVEMTPEGPDMDFVKKQVETDSAVKGIWCVPKYSNPQGITYSDETVKKFANLKPAAKDFRIFWDNAYFLHDLTEETSTLENLMEECEKYGNNQLPLMFYSTSKITFPGAGVAFLACRGENLKKLKENYSFKTVGSNKINQLRHLYFLKNKHTILNHMKKHREILKPKFDMIINILQNEFGQNKIIKWCEPKGGYFISVDTPRGCAKRTVELCKEAGVILTPAGATFPYGNDPLDKNIRLAPTYPSLADLKIAMEVFCLAVKISYLENKLS